MLFIMFSTRVFEIAFAIECSLVHYVALVLLIARHLESRILCDIYRKYAKSGPGGAPALVFG